MAARKKKKGSLAVVGTGIRVMGQLTTEAIAWMKAADRVFYIVLDDVAERAIQILNPRGAESLAPCYARGKPRFESYSAMIDTIMASVRAGERVVLALYGHPTVCAYPAHKVILLAREEDFDTSVSPGISAEDCLFADLAGEFDPAEHGHQTYEATYFLRHKLKVEPTAALILLMIGALGDSTHQITYDISADLPVLAKRLAKFYKADHRAIIYRAAFLPGAKPYRDDCLIKELPTREIPAMATLYIWPRGNPEPVV
jgi:siroheme synthase